MKTIEERALEQYPENWRNVTIAGTMEHAFDDNASYREGFINGAKSEHEELTKWNSPECPPDNRRQVLLKVKTSFIGKFYYKVGSFIGGDYCESYSGRPLKTECLGWREIHE